MSSATKSKSRFRVDDWISEIVTVLLEFDPRFRDVRADPVIWPAMVEEAQSLADRSFRRQHPKAVIERD